MSEESELLRDILSRLPPSPPSPLSPGWWRHEPEPDASLPLRDALADYLAARERWPGEPGAGRAGGCTHEFPEVIRIADLRLRDEPFRVLRCGACGGRLWAYRISEEMFSEHFTLWPLPDTEEKIQQFVAGFDPTARLVRRGYGLGSDPETSSGEASPSE